MKKIAVAALAATALVGFATSAAAQTNTRQYAGTASVRVGGANFSLNAGINNPSNVNRSIFGIQIPNSSDQALLDGLVQGSTIGTRFVATADAADDSTPATSRVDVVFNLSGSVNKDCSFYSGNNDAARNINFGVIGVKTGNNENVNQAFEMTSNFRADIDTLTAGCNTNNSVEISKNDLRGLVNANPGGYDTDEFQANIPYSVTARWMGVALNAQAGGSAQTLNVPTNGNAGQLQQGAWRSDMAIDIEAPAITDKGLVAGSYTGTTTVTLRAL